MAGELMHERAGMEVDLLAWPAISLERALESISVVIPALNEAHHLVELLPQLSQQSVPPLETIVADADSTDRTAETARRYGALVVPGGRPAFARNAGAQVARGDWLLFIDADTRLPRRDLLEDVLSVAWRQQASAVLVDYRPYYRPGDGGYHRPLLRVWDWILLLAVSEGQRGWLRLGFPFGQAVFLPIRRAVFRQLGGFDESAEPFEDSELLLRLHRRVPPPPNRRSALALLPRGHFVGVSTRRYDVAGRVAFPLSMGLRGGLLRFVLRREMPDPHYWDLNARGLYRERGSVARPSLSCPSGRSSASRPASGRGRDCAGRR